MSTPFFSRVAFLMIVVVLPMTCLLYLVRASTERIIGMSLRWRANKKLRCERQYCLAVAVAAVVFGSCSHGYYCSDCDSPRLFMLSECCAFTATTGWLVYFFVWLLSRLRE
jgi:hypothetical protein